MTTFRIFPRLGLRKSISNGLLAAATVGKDLNNALLFSSSSEEQDIDDVSDQVMQTLVTRGARLYQIERLSRDLDTIFRESTVSEERAQHEA